MKIKLTTEDGRTTSVDKNSLESLIWMVETILDSGDIYPYSSDNYTKEEIASAVSTFEAIRELISPIESRILRNP